MWERTRKRKREREKEKKIEYRAGKENTLTERDLKKNGREQKT